MSEEQLDRIEAKIDKITEELEELKRMLKDVHKHVGFVDSLSHVYENIRERGLRTVLSARSLLLGDS